MSQRNKKIDELETLLIKFDDDFNAFREAVEKFIEDYSERPIAIAAPVGGYIMFPQASSPPPKPSAPKPTEHSSILRPDRVSEKKFNEYSVWGLREWYHGAQGEKFKSACQTVSSLRKTFSEEAAARLKTQTLLDTEPQAVKEKFEVDRVKRVKLLEAEKQKVGEIFGDIQKLIAAHPKLVQWHAQLLEVTSEVEAKVSAFEKAAHAFHGKHRTKKGLQSLIENILPLDMLEAWHQYFPRLWRMHEAKPKSLIQFAGEEVSSWFRSDISPDPVFLFAEELLAQQRERVLPFDDLETKQLGRMQDDERALWNIRDPFQEQVKALQTKYPRLMDSFQSRHDELERLHRQYSDLPWDELAATQIALLRKFHHSLPFSLLAGGERSGIKLFEQRLQAIISNLDTLSDEAKVEKRADAKALFDEVINKLNEQMLACTELKKDAAALSGKLAKSPKDDQAESGIDEACGKAINMLIGMYESRIYHLKAEMKYFAKIYSNVHVISLLRQLQVMLPEATYQRICHDVGVTRDVSCDGFLAYAKGRLSEELYGELCKRVSDPKLKGHDIKFTIWEAGFLGRNAFEDLTNYFGGDEARKILHAGVKYIEKMKADFEKERDRYIKRNQKAADILQVMEGFDGFQRAQKLQTAAESRRKFADRRKLKTITDKLNQSVSKILLETKQLKEKWIEKKEETIHFLIEVNKSHQIVSRLHALEVGVAAVVDSLNSLTELAELEPEGSHDYQQLVNTFQSLLEQAPVISSVARNLLKSPEQESQTLDRFLEEEEKKEVAPEPVVELDSDEADSEVDPTALMLYMTKFNQQVVDELALLRESLDAIFATQISLMQEDEKELTALWEAQYQDAKTELRRVTSTVDLQAEPFAVVLKQLSDLDERLSKAKATQSECESLIARHCHKVDEPIVIFSDDETRTATLSFRQLFSLWRRGPVVHFTDSWQEFTNEEEKRNRLVKEASEWARKFKVNFRWLKDVERVWDSARQVEATLRKDKMKYQNELMSFQKEQKRLEDLIENKVQSNNRLLNLFKKARAILLEKLPSPELSSPRQASFLRDYFDSKSEFMWLVRCEETKCDFSREESETRITQSNDQFWNLEKRLTDVENLFLELQPLFSSDKVRELVSDGAEGAAIIKRKQGRNGEVKEVEVDLTAKDLDDYERVDGALKNAREAIDAFRQWKKKRADGQQSSIERIQANGGSVTKRFSARMTELFEFKQIEAERRSVEQKMGAITQIRGVVSKELTQYSTNMAELQKQLLIAKASAGGKPGIVFKFEYDERALSDLSSHSSVTVINKKDDLADYRVRKSALEGGVAALTTAWPDSVSFVDITDAMQKVLAGTADVKHHPLSLLATKRVLIRENKSKVEALAFNVEEMKKEGARPSGALRRIYDGNAATLITLQKEQKRLREIHANFVKSMLVQLQCILSKESYEKLLSEDTKSPAVSIVTSGHQFVKQQQETIQELQRKIQLQRTARETVSPLQEGDTSKIKEISSIIEKMLSQLNQRQKTLMETWVRLLSEHYDGVVKKPDIVGELVPDFLRKEIERLLTHLAKKLMAIQLVEFPYYLQNFPAEIIGKMSSWSSFRAESAELAKLIMFVIYGQKVMIWNRDRFVCEGNESHAFAEGFAEDFAVPLIECGEKERAKLWKYYYTEMERVYGHYQWLLDMKSKIKPYTDLSAKVEDIDQAELAPLLTWVEQSAAPFDAQYQRLIELGKKLEKFDEVIRKLETEQAQFGEILKLENECLALDKVVAEQNPRMLALSESVKVVRDQHTLVESLEPKLSLRISDMLKWREEKKEFDAGVAALRAKTNYTAVRGVLLSRFRHVFLSDEKVKEHLEKLRARARSHGVAANREAINQFVAQLETGRFVWLSDWMSCIQTPLSTLILSRTVSLLQPGGDPTETCKLIRLLETEMTRLLCDESLLSKLNIDVIRTVLVKREITLNDLAFIADVSRSADIITHFAYDYHIEELKKMLDGVQTGRDDELASAKTKINGLVLVGDELTRLKSLRSEIDQLFQRISGGSFTATPTSFLGSPTKIGKGSRLVAQLKLHLDKLDLTIATYSQPVAAPALSSLLK